MHYKNQSLDFLPHGFHFNHSGSPNNTDCQRCVWTYNSTDNFFGSIDLKQPLGLRLQHRLEHHLQYSHRPAASRHRRFFPGSRLPICVLGDSQNRQLANALVNMNHQHCDAMQQQRNHSVCGDEPSDASDAPAVRFALWYPTYWGFREIQGFERQAERDPKSSKSIFKCRTLIANFGQWPLGFQAASGPVSLQNYEESVRRVMQWMLAFGSNHARGNVSIAWTSVYPFPLNDGTGPAYAPHSTKVKCDLTHCPPTDWRFPHLIDAYNIAARRVASELGVTFIDLHALTFDVQVWPPSRSQSCRPVSLSPATLLIFPICHSQCHVQELSFDTVHYGPHINSFHARCVKEWLRSEVYGGRINAAHAPGCWIEHNRR